MTRLQKFLSFIIPFDKFTLKTTLSRERVCTKIDEVTESSFSFGHSMFFGRVFNDSFRLMPNINYENDGLTRRNSFLPIIIGTLHTEGEKTEISVTMRLHSFITFIMGIFLFFTSFVLLSGLALLTASPAEGASVVGFSLLFLVLIELLAQLTFRIPAKRARARLEKLLADAEEANENSI